MYCNVPEEQLECKLKCFDPFIGLKLWEDINFLKQNYQPNLFIFTFSLHSLEYFSDSGLFWCLDAIKWNEHLNWPYLAGLQLAVPQPL